MPPPAAGHPAEQPRHGARQHLPGLHARRHEVPPLPGRPAARRRERRPSRRGRHRVGAVRHGARLCAHLAPAGRRVAAAAAAAGLGRLPAARRARSRPATHLGVPHPLAGAARLPRRAVPQARRLSRQPAPVAQPGARGAAVRPAERTARGGGGPAAPHLSPPRQVLMRLYTLRCREATVHCFLRSAQHHSKCLRSLPDGRHPPLSYSDTGTPSTEINSPPKAPRLAQHLTAIADDLCQQQCRINDEK
mmetsp:Transcript_48101/g.121409  ORF Transcript_48101/g.121409 Transcript_48101/m.121409 type:complete len:248 (-) Transcript_48101:212-955(-)